MRRCPRDPAIFTSRRLGIQSEIANRACPSPLQPQQVPLPVHQLGSGGFAVLREWHQFRLAGDERGVEARRRDRVTDKAF